MSNLFEVVQKELLICRRCRKQIVQKTLCSDYTRRLYKTCEADLEWDIAFAAAQRYYWYCECGLRTAHQNPRTRDLLIYKTSTINVLTLEFRQNRKIVLRCKKCRRTITDMIRDVNTSSHRIWCVKEWNLSGDIDFKLRDCEIFCECNANIGLYNIHTRNYQMYKTNIEIVYYNY